MIGLFIVSEKIWMLLTICVHDSSVATELSYTNRQEYSTLFWNYQHNYHIHKSSRTFNFSQKFSIKLSYTQIISEKSWMFLTICVYDSSVDIFREKLNVLDDCVYDNSIDIFREEFKNYIQRFSDIINRTIIYTNRQDHSNFIWNYQ
jgi:hypothetical protein